jgi:branched-chain amino acid transport system permease protein
LTRRLAAAACILAPLCYAIALPDYLVFGSQILVMALLAISLDLLVGYAGVATLGHAAFFGAGAYVAGLLSVHGWGEPLTGVLMAAGVAGALGVPIGLLTARSGTLARLMITLGIAVLLYETANRAAGVTGGADGLQGMEVWPLLGVFDFDLAGKIGFAYAWCAFGLGFILARFVVKSPFGLSLEAIRDNPLRAAGIGIPVKGRLTAAFVISAAIAGAAGAVLAQTTQVVALNVLSVQLSADVLVILIFGGIGRIYGGLIGATLYMGAHHWMSGLSPVYWQFWLGLVLIACAFLAPSGIMGLIAPRAGGRDT